MARTRSDDGDVHMALSAENNTGLSYAEPPARLAARFRRKSSSRRRSSNHSSRCSSLSSRHSRTSALSCHGGPQSTHIAQHLRRASIIESRKARLADRAAHAEQVRLRAAAAKAAPRAAYSEEKALAAQAAREKLLAEITARCEEEVRRAKKVAEETREKKAAEDARRRDEMEEKYAQAARRRSIYQSSTRRSRTTSLAAVEEKKINPVELKKIGQTAAAKVIQRTWKSWKQRKPAINFLKLNLQVDQLQLRDFEEVSKLIAEDETIGITRTLLKHFDLLDGGNDETSERGAARVFLSVFIILSHPVQTFSRGGGDSIEKELISKGQTLLDAFQTRIQLEARPGRKPAISEKSKEQLQFLFNGFNAAFHAWKSQDLGVLLDVMVGSFVNFDLILQSTKDGVDGYVAEDYLQAVRQEQIKLLARLKRLAGPDEALARVRAAVKKARKERASKRSKPSSSANTVPRTSSDTEVVLDIPTTEPLTPPATPLQSGYRQDPHASSFINRLGQTMTVLPTNREIAHEMQINGSFEVQQQPWTDSRRVLMESLQDSMRYSMQNGGPQVASSWTHAMAVLIREKLLNLISQRHPLYDRVDGLVDPKLIEQQSRNGMFSYTSFFESIGNLIAQICSPGRDEAVRAFVSDTNGDTIDRLFTLINIIDLMTLDHVNFQFRVATKSVIEHGHEHEFGMFERDLQDGRHTLERAKNWWTMAKTNVPSTATQTAAYGNAIYSRGLVDLVFANNPIQYSDLPETLNLDWIRVLNLRARAFHIVMAASVLLTTKIRLRRNRESLWANDAERLLSLDLNETESSRIVNIIASGHMMPESTKEGLQNFVSRVLPPAVSALRRTKKTESGRMAAIQGRTLWDPSRTSINTADVSGDVFTEQIATFILKSLREHIFTRISAASTAEKVRATTSASEVLARAGMPEFVSEVGILVDTLERIRNVDLKAHGKWYNDVANAVTNTNASA